MLPPALGRPLTSRATPARVTTTSLRWPSPRWLAAGLCALVVAAGVAGFVAESNEIFPTAGPGQSPTTIIGSTTSSPPPVSQSTTVPPAGSAAADVTVTACEVDPNDPALADIAGRIANSTDQAQDYSINLVLMQGTSQVGTANGYEQDVGGGQVTTWNSFGALDGAGGGALTCEVASVTRTPSSS